MVHPIIDQYYSHNPYHHRSSKYVVEKGLVTNEKAGARATATPRGAFAAPCPLTTPLLEEVKRTTPQSRLSEVLRSRSPAETLPTYSQHIQAETLIPLAGPNDERHTSPMLYPMSGRDPSRRQEQTNTKKKRISRPDLDEDTAQEEQNGREEERQSSYGNQAKIAQYFPELRLS